MLLIDVITDIILKYSTHKEIHLNCGSIPAKNFLLDELNTFLLNRHLAVHHYTNIMGTYIILPESAINQLHYLFFNSYPSAGNKDSSIYINIAAVIGKKISSEVLENPIAICLKQQTAISALTQENQALKDKIKDLEAKLHYFEAQQNNNNYNPYFFSPNNSNHYNYATHQTIDLTQNVTYPLSEKQI